LIRHRDRTIHSVISCDLGHESPSLEESEDCRHNWPFV
jgi:hypothetical protein